MNVRIWCSCNELYKQNPRPQGMTEEEETKKLRAGKGEKGQDFSTACPMRSVVERKWKDIAAKQTSQ